MSIIHDVLTILSIFVLLSAYVAASTFCLYILVESFHFFHKEK